MKSKTDAASSTKDMVPRAENTSGEKLVTIRTDEAKKLALCGTKAFLNSNGNLIETVPL